MAGRQQGGHVRRFRSTGEGSNGRVQEIRKKNGYNYLQVRGPCVRERAENIEHLEDLRLKCTAELLAAHVDDQIPGGLILPNNCLQRGPKDLAEYFVNTDNYHHAVLAHHGLVAQCSGAGIVCRANFHPPHGTRRDRLQAGLH